MAVTYGFYNALNHDRLYDAIQMSSIFDGIIRDGIFSTIGDTMIVTAPEDGMYVNVGSGRAWFNHTWTLNDTDYPIEADQAEVVLDRIDAVILEVNSSTEVRANSIKFLKGTPSTNPVKPTLTHNAEVNQYALAYVRIRAGQTTIFQSDIENAVGTDETPFITGVLQQVSIETLLKQWEAEFNTYFTNFKNTSTTEFNNWFAAKVSEYTAWFAQMQTNMDSNFDDFDAWFQRIKGQLSEDAAGHLQVQIDNLNSDLSGRIDDIADEKANNDIISDAWNTSTTYEVGQYCIYNNSLWKCLVQNSGQTPTEGTYWTNVSVVNEKANNDIISDAWNTSTTYEVGQYCIYNNSLWKCLVQNSGQTPTEGTYWTNVSVVNEIALVNNSLNKNLEWKLYKSINADNYIDISELFSLGFNELCIITYYGDNINNVFAPTIFPKVALMTEPKTNFYFTNGGSNSIPGFYAFYKCVSNKLSCLHFMDNGEEKLSLSTTMLYYR